MGCNGKLLPDLQGLAGWLATLNDQARSIFTNIAPIAVACCADTSRFTRSERDTLLLSLEKELHQRSDAPPASAIYSLMRDQDMPTISEFANLTSLSENKQTLVCLSLRGFSQLYAHKEGSKSKTNCDNLLKIVCTPVWKSQVRCEALLAMDRIAYHTGRYSNKLRQILNEIKEKNIPDENHELLGSLLSLMYPNQLQPAEVWEYLVMDTVPHHHSSYTAFLANLIDRSKDSHIRELMDSLCDRALDVVSHLDNLGMAGIVIQMLARGLELFGDELSISELYRWFELVEYDNHLCHLTPAVVHG